LDFGFRVPISISRRDLSAAARGSTEAVDSGKAVQGLAVEEPRRGGSTASAVGCASCSLLAGAAAPLQRRRRRPSLPRRPPSPSRRAASEAPRRGCSRDGVGSGGMSARGAVGLLAAGGCASSSAAAQPNDGITEHSEGRREELGA
jgi:hypothetical protein